MNTRIYPNHLIKQPNPWKDPIIAVDDGKRVMYVNAVALLDAEGRTVARFVVRKSRGTNGHRIKMWVETNLEVKVS